MTKKEKWGVLKAGPWKSRNTLKPPAIPVKAGSYSSLDGPGGGLCNKSQKLRKYEKILAIEALMCASR